MCGPCADRAHTERGLRSTNLLGVLVDPLPVVRIADDAGKLDRVIIEKHASEEEWTEERCGGCKDQADGADTLDRLSLSLKVEGEGRRSSLAGSVQEQGEGRSAVCAAANWEHRSGFVDEPS